MPPLRSPRALLGVAALTTLVQYREAILGYAATCGLIYVFARVTTRSPATDRAARDARWQLFCAAMVLLIVLFVAAQWRVVHIEDGVTRTERFVAASINMWALLRFVNFLWDVGSGRIKVPAPLPYALWMALPFTAAGPLIRYVELLPQLATEENERIRAVAFTPEWWRKLAQALTSLAAGLALSWLATSGLIPGVAGTALNVLFFFPWGWYLSTSGGYNLMESLALLWGIRIPPSFDSPFGKRNISDFWASWNMTATRIFRDYLFYNRWGRKTVNVYANTMVLFGLVGLWHGSNAYWLVWGLWHGLGFCFFLWYKKHAASLGLERVGWTAQRAATFGPALTYVWVVAAWAVPIHLIRAARSVL